MLKQENKHIDFILASASPRRKLILRRAGFKFRILPSHVNERNPGRLAPPALVKHLAIKKALSIAKKNPADLVLGADTIVFVKNRVIGKPRNQSHAKKILRLLSGSWQRVYTGVAVAADGGRFKRAGVSVSYVKFRDLSAAEIEKASHRHMDKAGAYSIQTKGDKFVAELRGDYDNVVGLPMKLVRRLFRSVRFKAVAKPV